MLNIKSAVIIFFIGHIRDNQINALYNRITLKKSNRTFSMNDTEFHQLVDNQFDALEQLIDESGADIDYENVGNVITLEFDDGTQVVINRQEPMHEIWLASKSGGFHFQFKEEKWLCSKTHKEFLNMVKEECEKQAGEVIDW